MRDESAEFDGIHSLTQPFSKQWAPCQAQGRRSMEPTRSMAALLTSADALGGLPNARAAAALAAAAASDEVTAAPYSSTRHFNLMYDGTGVVLPSGPSIKPPQSRIRAAFSFQNSRQPWRRMAVSLRNVKGRAGMI